MQKIINLEKIECLFQNFEGLRNARQSKNETLGADFDLVKIFDLHSLLISLTLNIINNY